MLVKTKGMEINLLQIDNFDYPVYSGGYCNNKANHYLRNKTIDIVVEIEDTEWSYKKDHEYGVADNLNQVYEYHKELIENNNCVLVFDVIWFKDQPETHGWRWHKWGTYIAEELGLYTPQCEYGYDEQLTKEWAKHSKEHSYFEDTVLIYNIYVLKEEYVEKE